MERSGHAHGRAAAYQPRSLELFAGGGGLALGAHEAGFEHTALIEFDNKACDTLRHNAKGEHAAWSHDQVWCADVRLALNDGSLASIGDVDLIAGGPPCQPFSLGGEHRGMADERNMFPAALDYVRAFLPKLVIFENVPGLERPSFRPYLQYVEDQLRWVTTPAQPDEDWRAHHARILARRSGPLHTRYRVTRQVINSADLGVPQTRRRVFLMAIRADIIDSDPLPIESTHSRDALLYSQWVEPTYWARHGLDEPPRPDDLNERQLHQLKLDGMPDLQPWRTVRDALAGRTERGELPLPVPREGIEHPRILNHVGIPGARAYPGHTGSPIDWPSKTIKAGVHGVCGGEAMIRFSDGTLRYMTVREAARIQTFPDWYEFLGARSHAMRHIGNAVAVEVGRVVSAYLRGLAGL